MGAARKKNVFLTVKAKRHRDTTVNQTSNRDRWPFQVPSSPGTPEAGQRWGLHGTVSLGCFFLRLGMPGYCLALGEGEFLSDRILGLGRTPLPHPPHASPPEQLGSIAAVCGLIHHSEGSTAAVRSPGTALPWPHLIEIQAQCTLGPGKWLPRTQNK